MLSHKFVQVNPQIGGFSAGKKHSTELSKYSAGRTTQSTQNIKCVLNTPSLALLNVTPVDIESNVFGCFAQRLARSIQYGLHNPF